MRAESSPPKDSERPPIEPRKELSSLLSKMLQGIISIASLLFLIFVVATVLNYFGYELTGFKGLLISAGVTWAVFASIGFIFLFFDWVKKRSVSSLQETSPGATTIIRQEPIEVPKLPVPGVPAELVQRCIDRDCILVAGSGMGAQAHFPTWREFAQALLDAAVKYDALPNTSEASYRVLLSQGRLDLVIDNITSGEKGREIAVGALRAIYGKPAELSHSHKLLAQIEFAGVVSMSFDGLMEKAFGSHDVMYLTSRDGDKLLEKLSTRGFFFHKTFDSLDNPMWTFSQYRDVLETNRLYAQFLSSLVFSRSLFFVGVSLKVIEEFLELIPGRTGQGQKDHFALVSIKDPAWEEKKSQLKRRFKVELIPYTATQGHSEVERFLQKLVNDYGKARSSRKPSDGSVAVGKLKSVVLENVGPFDHLALDLDDNWNILLGDNGVGKSTILKAIAVAFCGEAAKQYASRLIKVDTDGKPRSQATITLKTSEGEPYKTTIAVTTSGVELSSQPRRLMDVPGWLALGFPPLRTMSWKPAERQEVKGQAIFVPDDLLPLMQSGPDPRLDKLKDWILSLDHAAMKEDTPESERMKHKDLLDAFWRVIEEVTPGLKLTAPLVDASKGEIRITTDDGVVPLEAVSQGTTSLLGWVGILMQRLRDFSEPSIVEQVSTSHGVARTAFQRGSALVLIDEIDAHMHPVWQKLLVTKLQGIFSMVQFIATTHSPLIISSLKKENVKIFVRDPEMGHVRIEKPYRDFEGLRSDQILTSELFRMQTTRSLGTVEKIRRLSELLAKKDRGPHEEIELANLQNELDGKLWRGETHREREIEKAVHTVLLEQGQGQSEDSYAALKQLPPDDALEIRRQLGKLLGEAEDS